MEGNHSNAPAKTHVAPHPLPTEPHPTCPALVLMNLALDLTTWTQRHEMCISFPVCDLCRFGKHSHKLRDRGGLGVSAVRAKTGKWIVPTDRIIKWLDRKSLKLVLRIYSKLKHTHTHAHAHTHRDRHRHTHTHTHRHTHTRTHAHAHTVRPSVWFCAAVGIESVLAHWVLLKRIHRPPTVLQSGKAFTLKLSYHQIILNPFRNYG